MLNLMGKHKYQTNKCLEGYLRCFASNKQTQWVKWLSLAKCWYNTSLHIDVPIYGILLVPPTMYHITLERQHESSRYGRSPTTPPRISLDIEGQPSYVKKI